MKISATIITFNEAAHIREACASLAWADEIVVVDSESTDETVRVAEECGARVIVQKWLGFSRQKQFATDATRHEWVFSLDADERVSPELMKSIEVLRSMPDERCADGYRVNRRTRYMNRWIKGGGWYPDAQLRLYRKARGGWQGAYIHESVKMDAGARVSHLNGDILHFSVGDAAHHHRMIGERYAPLAARQMYEQGRRTSPLHILAASPLTFLRSFVWRGGWRDGLAGYAIARFAAHHAFLKQMMLRELQQQAAGAKRKDESGG